MSREVSSISRFGLTEPFEFQVGRGQIAYHSVVHVFGYNPDVDTEEETIWPIDGLLGHPPSVTTMTISSSSANDTAAGTGARTVFIEGVNGSGGYVSEIVTLNGQTGVSTVNAYDAIERMVTVTAGSGGENEGIIYAGTGAITLGVPAVAYSAMGAGENASLVGHWTCPAGHTGYLVYGKITVGPTSGNHFVLARLKLRLNSGIVVTAAKTAIQQGEASYPFDYPVVIREGECITATAQNSGTNAAVSSYFQIVLVRNG